MGATKNVLVGAGIIGATYLIIPAILGDNQEKTKSGGGGGNQVSYLIKGLIKGLGGVDGGSTKKETTITTTSPKTTSYIQPAGVNIPKGTLDPNAFSDYPNKIYRSGSYATKKEAQEKSDSGTGFVKNIDSSYSPLDTIKLGGSTKKQESVSYAGTAGQPVSMLQPATSFFQKATSYFKATWGFN